MENLDRGDVSIKLNLQPKKRWKMRIYLLMMLLNVMNLEMVKSVIKLKKNNKKERSLVHTTLLDIFYLTPNKS